jgi:hypothetical protein
MGASAAEVYVAGELLGQLRISVIPPKLASIALRCYTHQRSVLVMQNLENIE